MNLEKEIEQVFCLTANTIISDEFIQDNPDLMWIKNEINLIEYVPSYMLWCIRHKKFEGEGSLIYDFTLNALAEYGRAKDKENSYLNFKHLCNAEQKAVVYNFLKWCEANLEHINEKQLQRTLKHWAQ